MTKAIRNQRNANLSDYKSKPVTRGADKLNISKYRIFIILLKYIPFILAVCYLLASILQVFDIETYLISYIGFIGIIPIAFFIFASVVFRFCEYHRIYLYYLLINEAFNIFDYNTELIGSNETYIRIHVIMFIIASLITTILYLYGQKNDNTTETVG